jgi:peptidoglycan/xylan/chitin deacetylase (PgdA/CDA1 family)
VFRVVNDALRSLPHALRREALDQMLAQAHLSTSPRSSHRPLTPLEVRELGSAPLIEVGAHTMTHPRLSALGRDDQAQELRVSKSRLEEMLAAEVKSFAYPFGSRDDYSATSVEIARESGFAIACANFEAPVSSACSPWELPRMMVMNTSAETLLARLEALWTGEPTDRDRELRADR